MGCIPESIADERCVPPLLVFLQILEDPVFLALGYFGTEMDACIEMPRRGLWCEKWDPSQGLTWSIAALPSS